MVRCVLWREEGGGEVEGLVHLTCISGCAVEQRGIEGSLRERVLSETTSSWSVQLLRATSTSNCIRMVWVWLPSGVNSMMAPVAEILPRTAVKLG